MVEVFERIDIMILVFLLTGKFRCRGSVQVRLMNDEVTPGLNFFTNKKNVIRKDDRDIG